MDTIHINDLRKITDTREIWFSEEEIEAIRSNRLDVLDCMESGVPFDAEEECSRGLEPHLETVRRVRRQNIMEAVFAVLDEQDLQRDEGINDPELLADVYFSRSYESGLDAYWMGLQDRKEAVA